MRTARLLLGLLVVVGCGDGTTPSTPAPYSITPVTQWSGGVVRISSANLRPGGAAPGLTANGATMSAVRLNDSTFEATLPVLPSGPATLRLSGTAGDSVGVVQVVGFHQARTMAGALGFEPLVVAAGGGTLVFVAESLGASGQATNRALAILDPNTGLVTVRHGIGPVLSAFGMQPSYQANRFVLVDSLDRVGVWQLFPAPSFQVLAPDQALGMRHYTQLSDTIWMELRSNGYQSLTANALLLSAPGLISDPIRIVFSPAGDRVALVQASSPTHRVPVFVPQTGDTAYTIQLPGTNGAVFSPTGDRLYFGAPFAGASPVDSLIVVRAATGARVAAARLPSGFAGSTLAVDPATGWLYQVADSGGALAVFVYDGTTLARIGRLGCIGPCGNANYWSAGLSVDVGAGLIHVAYPGQPIPVVTFDRLP